jgi:ribosomal protein S27AE
MGVPGDAHVLAALAATRVQFCPSCGSDLTDERAFVQEYWSAADQNFFCWCPRCGVMCTVTLSERVISHEPEH